MYGPKSVYLELRDRAVERKIILLDKRYLLDLGVNRKMRKKGKPLVFLHVYMYAHCKIDTT